MAEQPMLQVNVRFDFFSFGELRSTYVICFENKHPPFSAPLRINEAPVMREPNLHSLVDDLTDRHQVLGDRWDVPHYPFLPTWLRGTSPMCSIG